MLTNATILRIDQQNGIASDGTPTWANGPTISARCTLSKAGEIFGDNSTEKQVLYPQMGRLYVAAGELPDNMMLNRGQRVLVQPDGGDARTYVVNLAWEHGPGHYLHHFELDLRDA